LDLSFDRLLMTMMMMVVNNCHRQVYSQFLNSFNYFSCRSIDIFLVCVSLCLSVIQVGTSFVCNVSYCTFGNLFLIVMPLLAHVFRAAVTRDSKISDSTTTQNK